MKKLIKNAVIGMISAAVLSFGAAAVSSSADWHQYGYMGDLNNDKEISVADMVLLAKHLLREGSLTAENGYDLRGKYVGINGADGFLAEKILETADINQDGSVDVFDLVMLRQYVVNNTRSIVWQWEDDIPETTTTTTVTVPVTTTTTAVTAAASFISPPIYDLYGSLPSQGKVEVAVFYVDFPDCRYSYMPSVDEIEKAAFGDKNESDSNYPFESMRAFYERSSKGAMELGGKVYTYTTKNSKSYYENDGWHISLVEELISAFDGQVDFSQFDGDNDRTIDAILISVPEAAGDDDWWPAAGIYGGETWNRADGMNIGHVIVGNAEIVSNQDHSNFCSSYLHEMGHCMGLPDYYLYTDPNDFQGMHGSAGFEMMDDAMCDFGAASKLMLGWYTSDQISVYDKNKGTQSYTLKSGQTNGGNCVIIPVGTLDSKYYSEFFILEYTDLSGNNSDITKEWWRATGSGVRMYHVDATTTGGYYDSFKYQSGNDEDTNYNNGRRFIRLVNEGDNNSRNLFDSGSVINGSIQDYRIYDSNGGLTVSVGVSVNIGQKQGDSYEITIYPD